MKRRLLFVMIAGLIGLGVATGLNAIGLFAGWEREAYDARLNYAVQQWRGDLYAPSGLEAWREDRERCQVVLVLDGYAPGSEAPGPMPAEVYSALGEARLLVNAGAVATIPDVRVDDVGVPIGPAAVWLSPTVEDSDGGHRRFDPEALARLAEELDVSAATIAGDADGSDGPWVPYIAPPGSFPVIDYDALVAEPDRPEFAALIRDRILVFGRRPMPAAEGYPVGYPLVRTPLTAPRSATISVASAGSTRMVRAEVTANAIQAVLDREPPLRDGSDLGLPLQIAAGLVVVLLVAMLPPLVAVIALVLLIAAITGAGTLALSEARLVLPVVAPAMAGVIVAFSGGITKWLADRRDQQFVRRLFRLYVPEAVERKAVRAKELPSAQGERRDVTILFADIAGFTSWAERTDPEELVARLNAFFRLVTIEVAQERGVVDKFMGDSVMAVWNGALPQKSHARNALRAAMSITERLAEERRSDESELPPLDVRIALHTGEAVVGNVGSEGRLAYTVLGDAVNVASRMEGVAKKYRVRCAVSAATLTEAGGTEEWLARPIDRVRVKGRREPINVFEPLAPRDGPGARREWERYAAHVRQGFDAYLAGRWTVARMEYSHALGIRENDPVCQLMLRRIDRFEQQSPPEGWDGSVELMTK